MPLENPETAVLLLKDVMFRHSEFRSLEEFLVEKYGFSKVEDRESALSEMQETIPIESRKIILKEEEKALVIAEEIEEKMSSLKILEGNYMDAKISIWIMGEVFQKEDVIAAANMEGECTAIYTSEYQMIKLISKSGYAIQQLVEKLTIDVGLKIGMKEWFFHRCEEG